MVSVDHLLLRRFGRLMLLLLLNGFEALVIMVWLKVIKGLIGLSRYERLRITLALQLSKSVVCLAQIVVHHE